QIAKTRETFLARGKLELGDLESAAADLEQQLTLASTKTEQITLSAPVTGTVKALQAASPGRIVMPNEALMNIVPDEGAPEIVAYLPKAEIRFVEPNQEAVIKVDSSPSEGYGSISGKVMQISAKAEPASKQFRPKEKAAASDETKSKREPIFPVL